jgi:hypothetical protein
MSTLLLIIIYSPEAALIFLKLTRFTEGVENTEAARIFLGDIVFSTTRFSKPVPGSPMRTGLLGSVISNNCVLAAAF